MPIMSEIQDVNNLIICSIFTAASYVNFFFDHCYILRTKTHHQDYMFHKK